MFWSSGLCVLLLGCASFPDHTAAERLDSGYTLVLPGIDGRSSAIQGFAQGLVDSGLPSAVEIYDWTSGNPLMMGVHLHARDDNMRRAEKIADKIVAYQNSYPRRPVHLIGHSGGCALALWTLEKLPAERRVTDAVLLSAAVSADYDTSSALNHTERGIYNFTAPADIMLVAGTTLGGTMDGVWAPGAGAFGFAEPPDHRDSPGVPRIQEIAYEPRMALSGHLGGHWGPSSRAFARDYVAPILAQKPRRDGLRPRISQRLPADRFAEGH